MKLILQSVFLGLTLTNFAHGQSSLDICKDYVDLAQEFTTIPNKPSYHRCVEEIEREKNHQALKEYVSQILSKQTSVTAKIRFDEEKVEVKSKDLKLETLQCGMIGEEEFYCVIDVRSCSIDSLALQGTFQKNGQINLDLDQTLAKRGGCMSWN